MCPGTITWPFFYNMQQLEPCTVTSLQELPFDQSGKGFVHELETKAMLPLSLSLHSQVNWK